MLHRTPAFSYCKTSIPPPTPFCPSWLEYAKVIIAPTSIKSSFLIQMPIDIIDSGLVRPHYFYSISLF